MPSVYFFIMHDPASPDRDFGQVKVGITTGDVARRIAQLQTGNPWELRCVDYFETPCAREVEHFVHRTHAEAMQHLEWLRCSRNDVRALVDEAKQAARRNRRANWSVTSPRGRRTASKGDPVARRRNCTCRPEA